MSESDRHLLDRAVELSARARSIRARSPGVDLAMSCKQWDDLLLLAGAPGRDRAEVLEEGLALLAVDDLPHQVLEIADRLGAIHSENQEWARAADAYANAIAALDWIYQELSGQRSRVAELTTNYKLRGARRVRDGDGRPGGRGRPPARERPNARARSGRRARLRRHGLAAHRHAGVGGRAPAGPTTAR